MSDERSGSEAGELDPTFPGGVPSPGDDSTQAAAGSDPAPQRIGPYKILSKLGEGGFGVVCLAEQEKSVRRRVALKISNPGMDSKAVIGRFEAERQALALMNHPNVAAVYDAGTTEQGRPYFIMEHVPGVLPRRSSGLGTARLFHLWPGRIAQVTCTDCDERAPSCACVIP